jgi:chromosome segregation ATPase
MSDLDRSYAFQSECPLEADPIEPSEGVLRFLRTPPSAATRVCGDALGLVYQAAEIIKGIENQANEAEKQARDAENRVQELETELELARTFIKETRVKLKEADEAAKVERSRLEAADRKLCQLEMRARTAEAQARENANAVLRIQEAIRSQLVANRRLESFVEVTARDQYGPVAFRPAVHPTANFVNH